MSRWTSGQQRARLHRRGGLLAVARLLVSGVLFVVAGCGGSTAKSVSPTSSSSDQATSVQSDSASSTASSSAALSAADLEQLVVSAPAPFAQLPDSTLKTGLMEAGNPSSGVIGIGFAKEAEIVGAGFQRGWEKAFRAPDQAVVDINVFEFGSADGPRSLVRLFESRAPSGYVPLDVPGLPDARGLSGTSPEGRTSIDAVLAHERFLVVVLGGGAPGIHDYEAIVDALMKDQAAGLPA